MGQDNESKPVIVVNIAALKLDKNNRFDAFDALAFTFIVARKFLCKPGVLEQGTLIIDLEGQGFFGFPVQEVKYLGEQLFKHFPCFIDMAFICNMPVTLKFLSKTFNRSQ